MIDVTFGNYLRTLTMFPVEQGKIDSDLPTARVWFQRSAANTSVLNDGTPYLDDTTFDVEVCSGDIDQTQAEATTIRTALNGYKGIMFPDRVLAVFVSDVADDYTPRNMGADDGYHVQAFQVRILS